MLKTLAVKIVIWLTFALACAACGGSIEPTAATSCEAISDLKAEDYCETSQFFVTLCTAPIPNPGGVDCNGPSGALDQKTGTIWCCK